VPQPGFAAPVPYLRLGSPTVIPVRALPACHPWLFWWLFCILWTLQLPTHVSPAGLRTASHTRATLRLDHTTAVNARCLNVATIQFTAPRYVPAAAHHLRTFLLRAHFTTRTHHLYVYDVWFSHAVPFVGYGWFRVRHAYTFRVHTLHIATPVDRTFPMVPFTATRTTRAPLYRAFGGTLRADCVLCLRDYPYAHRGSTTS